MPIAAPLIGKQRPHSMTNESEPLRHFQQSPDRSSRQSIDVKNAQVTRGTMSHETALSNVKEIADRILAPAARQSDKEGRFSMEAFDAGVVALRAGAVDDAGHAQVLQQIGPPLFKGHSDALTVRRA